jgi:hypothetical protein
MVVRIEVIKPEEVTEEELQEILKDVLPPWLEYELVVQ